MDAKAEPTAHEGRDETLLERAVKRQLLRLNEAEKRRRVKGREHYRQWRAEVLAKA